MSTLHKLTYLCFWPIVLCAIGIYFLFHADDWLVVDNQPGPSDVIVVLGGGGASRLSKGISLYDQGLSDALLLVDDKVSAWTHITAHLCMDCHLEGKNVVILTGSTSTFTDAQLVKEFCLLHRIKSILVVTDPYHTRRVLFTFQDHFKGSSILITVVNSGYYGFLVPPGNDWWTERQTLKTVLWELTKSLYVLGASFFKAAF